MGGTTIKDNAEAEQIEEGEEEEKDDSETGKERIEVEMQHRREGKKKMNPKQTKDLVGWVSSSHITS